MGNKYDEMMDHECISICDAINKCYGLKTYSSCCGHGERPFRVWLLAEHPFDLFPLVRMTSKNYCGYNWIVKAAVTDTEEYLVPFCLESESVGDIAFQEADEMAKDIKGLLEHKAAMKFYRKAKRRFGGR